MVDQGLVGVAVEEEEEALAPEAEVEVGSVAVA